MTMERPTPAVKLNRAGLSKNDYVGSPSTLCKGCGHNSVASQLIQIAYELDLRPQEIIKLSGIGCSSKSPAYFLGQSHGFNSLHGRMPSLGTGALVANHAVRAIGISGDGDTGSIGLGQFKHMLRRNVRMVYIVENNGVYGLTKGQFSATSDEGAKLKYAGTNPFPGIDICMEAIVAGAGFVARTFAGDAKQVREVIKAGLSYRGTAVIDIISPCVAFNDEPDSRHSYAYGREHELALQEVGFIPAQEEIYIDDYDPGTTQVVELHDGSRMTLRKLESDFDQADRLAGMARLERANAAGELLTGIVYYDDRRPNFAELSELGETPLSMLPDAKLRPSADQLQAFLAGYA
jgi:2-oxoglutarate ferredoxin oxidoreductase subunit beta